MQPEKRITESWVYNKMGNLCINTRYHPHAPKAQIDY